MPHAVGDVVTSVVAVTTSFPVARVTAVAALTFDAPASPVPSIAVSKDSKKTTSSAVNAVAQASDLQITRTFFLVLLTVL